MKSDTRIYLESYSIDPQTKGPDMNRSPPEVSYICTMKTPDTLTLFAHVPHPSKRKKDADDIMSEYNEEIGSDQGIGMDQILREAEENTASWKKNDMPGTRTLRRMILLADWASMEPKRWAAYKLFYYEKIGNTTVIAQKLHIAERTARRYLLPVKLGRHLRRRRTAKKPLRRLSRQSRGGDLGLNTL